MKKTKIVATISDKRCDVEFLESLYRAGMNVVRLNTAHQDIEQALKVVENVRKVSDDIAILIDTKGPEVRTMLMDEPMHVDRGETVYLTGDPELKMEGKLIHVSYPYFAEDIKVGSQNLATRDAIAIIGSVPASAADRSVADHILARRMITATSLLDVILLSLRSVPSMTCSDSPVRSSKNGILTIGEAWEARASNSVLFTIIPLCTSADNSIVRLITYGLKSSGTITSCKVVPAI